MRCHQGERNPNCRLTIEEVERIRKAYDEPMDDGGRMHSYASLAMCFGVSRSTIRAIVRRETWKPDADQVA